MLRLLWLAILGLVVGATARLLSPGVQSMALWMTGMVGVAGSFAGGRVALMVSKPGSGTTLQPAAIVMAIVGSLALLWIYVYFGH